MKLNYANVVSTLCLFLVLGGSAAFAATKLAKNSVGTAQIKDGAITSAKIKNGAITGAKVELSSLGTVPTAASAGSAKSAETAVRATSAQNANHAVSADSASHATSADSATHAGTADSATHAGTADSATHAGTADSATHATNADSATHATSADSAQNAADAAALGGVPAAGYQQKVMWARLEPSGAIVSQSGGITVEEHPEAGIYFLHFPATVADKAVTVSGSWTPAQIGKSPAFKAASCGPGGAGCNGDNTTSELFVEATEGSSIRDAGYFVLVTP